MHIRVIVMCLLILSVSVQHSTGSDFDFITVTDIVKKVKKRFSEIDSYRANFTIYSEKLGRKTTQSGVVKYKASNKMLIDFYHPRRYKIVSDGRMMWIYIPSMNVVAEQNLKVDSSSLFSSGTKSGLRRLFLKYHYKFASKKQPEIQPDGSKMYTLFLKQKERRGGFRTLKLWISEDYLIMKAYGKTAVGKKVEIRFSNIKTNISFSNSIFKFDIPSGARVIKNPMITEE